MSCSRDSRFLPHQYRPHTQFTSSSQLRDGCTSFTVFCHPCRHSCRHRQLHSPGHRCYRSQSRARASCKAGQSPMEKVWAHPWVYSTPVWTLSLPSTFGRRCGCCPLWWVAALGGTAGLQVCLSGSPLHVNSLSRRTPRLRSQRMFYVFEFTQNTHSMHERYIHFMRHGLFRQAQGSNLFVPRLLNFLYGFPWGDKRNPPTTMV